MLRYRGIKKTKWLPGGALPISHAEWQGCGPLSGLLPFVRGRHMLFDQLIATAELRLAMT